MRSETLRSAAKRAETVEALRLAVEALVCSPKPGSLQAARYLAQLAHRLCDHALIMPNGRCRYCGKREA